MKMKVKSKLLGAAVAVGALMAGVGSAHAEGAVSGNVALTTDYTFRGISQTEGGPAVQGGFDYTNGIFYAGTWASNVSSTTISSGGLELDLYAGVTPTLGPVSFSFGVIGYFYPGADDDATETDFYEGKASASITPVEPLTLKASLFYSPEFTLETGESLYWELAAGYAVSDSFALKASYGEQDADDYADSYTNWLIGGTYSIHGFSLGLSYVGAEDAFDEGYAIFEDDADERVVFSIGRAL